MKEKIHEVPIDSPLTPEKREAINEFILRNAHLSGTRLTHDWNEKGGQELRIITPPVTWEVKFDTSKVEVYASGPGWAKMLLTKKNRVLLTNQVDQILLNTGLITSPKSA